MVWESFPNHKSDHITSLIETLQNASPVVTAGTLEPCLHNQLEAILTAQGTHTNSWCAYICMTEVKVLWSKLTLNSCDALWYFLFYSILLFYKIQFHTHKNYWFQTVVLKKTLDSPSNSKEIKPVNPKGKSTVNIHWKDWCWSSNPVATWFEELTHWKRPWCWERVKAGKGDDRGWDGWMAPPTQWTRV